MGGAKAISMKQSWPTVTELQECGEVVVRLEGEIWGLEILVWKHLGVGVGVGITPSSKGLEASSILP
jgi:hypothetical protein